MRSTLVYAVEFVAAYGTNCLFAIWWSSKVTFTLLKAKYDRSETVGISFPLIGTSYKYTRF
jgi:hypothetical protein